MAHAVFPRAFKAVAVAVHALSHTVPPQGYQLRQKDCPMFWAGLRPVTKAHCLLVQRENEGRPKQHKWTMAKLNTRQTLYKSGNVCDRVLGSPAHFGLLGLGRPDFAIRRDQGSSIPASSRRGLSRRCSSQPRCVCLRGNSNLGLRESCLGLRGRGPEGVVIVLPGG